MAKAPQWDCPVKSVHPWHRQHQKRLLQGSRRVLVSFGSVALETELSPGDEEDQTAVCIAHSHRGPFCCGVAEGEIYSKHCGEEKEERNKQ